MKMKRLLALIMTFILIVGMIPFNAFAEDYVITGTTTDSIITDTSSSDVAEDIVIDEEPIKDTVIETEPVYDHSPESDTVDGSIIVDDEPTEDMFGVVEM